MGLFLDLRQLDLFGRHAQIQPGRHLRHRQAALAGEDQLADDLLHPSGAGLGVGSDDNVVIAKREIVPDGGIEMMIVKFAPFLRIDRHLAPQDIRPA
jgi:hypothetical protein